MPKIDRPNVDNLKKRAKTLVRQHRERYHPVAAKLRAAVPRFAALSDRAILDAHFTLADAQRVVAQEAGYADWAQASRELSQMTNHITTSTTPPTSESPAPRLRAAYPQLFVADVGRAAAYYQQTLGFSIAYVYGEPPFYGLVTRDGVGLNLRHVDGAPIDPGLRDRESLLAANVVVEGVKAWFLELQARGAAFAQTLKEQPWGASDFIVRDPDGNLICFASAVDHHRQ